MIVTVSSDQMAAARQAEWDRLEHLKAMVCLQNCSPEFPYEIAVSPHRLYIKGEEGALFCFEITAEEIFSAAAQAVATRFKESISIGKDSEIFIAIGLQCTTILFRTGDTHGRFVVWTNPFVVQAVNNLSWSEKFKTFSPNLL